jgi:hypothetical protein
MRSTRDSPPSRRSWQRWYPAESQSGCLYIKVALAVLLRTHIGVRSKDPNFGAIVKDLRKIKCVATITG